MRAKRLTVYSDGVIVGRLTENPDGELNFAYDPTWIENPLAIELCPDMPVSDRVFRGAVVEPFFENLLPEGGVLNFISSALHISRGNTFGLLERFGGDTAGKFSILPEKVLPTGGSRYLAITPQEILEVFDQFMGVPLNIAGEESRASLPGAQDKMALFIDAKGGLFILLGDSPSSHIIKPSLIGRRNIKNTAINESLVMGLAKKIGLDVADTYYSPELGAIVVSRYDRETRPDGSLGRVHQIDLCQSLGIPPGKKYQAEGGPSLKQCFEVVLGNSIQPENDRIRLIEWVAFNLLVGNMDGHAKNLSLLAVGDTWGTSKTRLAPFYDMVCTAIYPNLSPRFAFNIGGENRPRWIKVRHWQRFADEIGLRPEAVMPIIAHVVSKVEMALPGTIQSFLERATGSEEVTLDEIKKYIAKSSNYLKQSVAEHLSAG